MNETEDLLVRTLRDPGRALPVPADALPGIRARAGSQRRTGVLATAAVALLAAAALIVPAAVLRSAPAPVATQPAPGLLQWPGRGALIGDADLLRDAARTWPDRTGPAHALWADRLGGRPVVLLQGFDGAGRPLLVLVGERGDGVLRFVASSPLPDTGVVALRLVDPGAAADSGTLLLVTPAGTGGTVVLPAAGEEQGGPAGGGRPRRLPPEPSGLLATPDDLAGASVTVVGADRRVVGSGEVPPARTLTVGRGPVRLAAPSWDFVARAAEPADLDDAGLLAGRVGGGVVEAALLDASAAVDIATGRAEPRFYELRKDGRTWLASAVWIGDRAYCVQVRELPGAPPVLATHCRLPARQGDVVYVEPPAGARLVSVRIAAAGPGERAVRKDWQPALPGGYVALERAGAPSGTGTVDVLDRAGRPASVPLPLVGP